jgi:hypothetical protein
MTDIMKLDFKNIATDSLQKEEESIKRRFAAADQVLNRSAERTGRQAQKPKTTQDKKKPKGKPGRKKSAEPVVRDIFSMPESDYQLIAKATRRCAQAGTVLYKSQIARLALVALDSLNDRQLTDVIKTFAQREVERQQQ